MATVLKLLWLMDTSRIRLSANETIAWSLGEKCNLLYYK
jgi:hypothetical protein